MEQIYAQALWEMIENGMKPKAAVHALREILVRLGRERLLRRVGRAFARLADQNRTRTRIVLSVARKGDEGNAHRAIKKPLNEMGATTKEVTTHVDDSLIGGWRLEGRERLVDASFKKQLLEMYNRATQS